jgi:secreted Zn-dependent insulinase-like peptidase
LTGENPDVSS